jgi:hypothetical protein
MSEIENIRVLADVASESGSYEDSYKYSSRILELDIKDATAWINKGVAASFLTDTSGSKIGESRALIKKGIEIGVDVSKKIEIVNKIKLAYNNYCTRLHDEMVGKVKDFQKVAMPSGGSILMHGLGQAANTVVTAKNQAGARVKGLELVLLICEVMPTADNYNLATIAIANALKHSKINGNYLDGSEPHCARYREISNEVDKKSRAYFPSSAVASAASVTSSALNTKKDGCFIATAATGSYDHPKVIKLRQYRDNVLLKSNVGKSFVKNYYIISPLIANIIVKSVVLKFLVMKLIVNPAVVFLNKKYK